MSEQLALLIAGAIIMILLGIIGWLVRNSWTSHLEDAKSGFARLEAVEIETAAIKKTMCEFRPTEMERRLTAIETNIQNLVGWAKRLDAQLTSTGRSE